MNTGIFRTQCKRCAKKIRFFVELLVVELYLSASSTMLRGYSSQASMFISYRKAEFM